MKDSISLCSLLAWVWWGGAISMFQYSFSRVCVCFFWLPVPKDSIGPQHKKERPDSQSCPGHFQPGLCPTHSPSPLRLLLVFTGHISIWKLGIRPTLELSSGWRTTQGRVILFIQVKHGAGADTCLSCQNDLHGIKSKRKFTAEAHGTAGASHHPIYPSTLYIDLTAEHKREFVH